MIANDGNNEGLFRGAFMQSGAQPPIGKIDNARAQLCTLGSVLYTYL
jgi:hypothetical protein